MNRWVSPFEPKTKRIAAIEIITVGLGLYINSGTRQLNYTEDETWCRARDLNPPRGRREPERSEWFMGSLGGDPHLPIARGLQRDLRGQIR